MAKTTDANKRRQKLEHEWKCALSDLKWLQFILHGSKATLVDVNVRIQKIDVIKLLMQLVKSFVLEG